MTRMPRQGIEPKLFDHHDREPRTLHIEPPRWTIWNGGTYSRRRGRMITPENEQDIHCGRCYALQADEQPSAFKRLHEFLLLNRDLCT